MQTQLFHTFTWVLLPSWGTQRSEQMRHIGLTDLISESPYFQMINILALQIGAGGSRWQIGSGFG